MTHNTQYDLVYKTLHQHLSPLEALLYARMKDDFDFFLKSCGFYQPVNVKYQEWFNAGKNTIQRAINKLIEKEYVVIVSSRKGCANIYHINAIDSSGLPVKSEPVIGVRLRTIIGG